MSLVRIAARIAIRQALLGKTKVGDNVLDSQIGLIDSALAGEEDSPANKPFISIYADAGSSRESDNDLRSFSSNGLTDFMFEVGFSARHVTTDPDTDEAVVLEGIPATDDSFEFFLDMVVRQIGDALNDADDPWADLARRLIRKVSSIERAVATSGQRGVRVALHQMRVQVELIRDPLKGTPLSTTHPMTTFFSLVEGMDEACRAKAAEMLAQLEDMPTALQSTVQRYGFTRQEAEALLLAPVSGVPEDTGITEIVVSEPETAP